MSKKARFSMESLWIDCEQELEKILSRVGLNRGEVTATVIEVKRELEDLVAPFEGYEELTAKELVERLGEMDEAELRAVRAFEAGTKNRVTVLREIDERLDEMEAVSA